MELRGIRLNLDFVQGRGDVLAMPAGPGIYAEIHWPTRSLRIGESQAVRARNLSHIRWADRHRSGTHNAKEANRRGPIVELVRVWGSEGLEHYLISADARLADRELRVECEKYLHGWARTQTVFCNISTQRGYRTVN
ncbi:MAG TPA: hypothetical protein PKD10_12850 [Paracoccaceae bacterium]|nr:hypothetical protein [Paracoccaceae bacterium]HMO71149.1 hypothetical protein [Paracoccaceae bacterium]